MVISLSYYELLQVSHTATLDEIRKAYRRLALVMHPDKGGSVSAFQDLVHAFEMLSDAVVQEQYDHFESGNRRSDAVQTPSKKRCYPGATSPSGGAKRTCIGVPSNESHGSVQMSAESTTSNHMIASEGRILDRLFTILGSAPPQERRALLSRLSSRARAGLLSRFAGREPNAEMESSAGAETEGEQSFQDISSSGSESDAPLALPASLDTPASVDSAPLSSVGNRMRGICRRCTNPVRYNALTVVNGFVIRSRLLESLDTAIEYHVLLVQIKQAIWQRRQQTQTCSFEVHVKMAVDAVMSENAVTSAELGLRFSTQVHSYSKLFTPEITDIQMALSEWRAMQNACAKGWEALRLQWIELHNRHKPSCQQQADSEESQLSGKSGGDTFQQRLQRWDERRAQTLRQTDLRAAEKMENERQQRLSSVQKLNQQLARLGRVEEEALRKQRAALNRVRLQWHHRKDLTMAEILQGPPV